MLYRYGLVARKKLRCASLKARKRGGKPLPFSRGPVDLTGETDWVVERLEHKLATTVMVRTRDNTMVLSRNPPPETFPQKYQSPCGIGVSSVSEGLQGAENRPISAKSCRPRGRDGLGGGPTGVKLGTGKSLFLRLFPSRRARFRNPKAMPPVRASGRRHRPSIDNVFGARNGSGARRSQKRDQVCHLFGFGWATEWYPAEAIHDDLLPALIVRAGLFC